MANDVLLRNTVPEPVAYESAAALNQGEAGVDEELAQDVVAAPVTESESMPQDAVIPAAYNLAIPFQSQAPHANWDLPYGEACEEASLIMADRFFKGESLGPEEMDAEILRVVDWEKETFGYYEDTKAAEVVVMAREYFGLNATLDYDVSVANIKSHLAANKAVVVPAAGRMLKNPYFSGEGPVYHMLVIRGYTDTHFIANDPGTKRGGSFLYAYDVLIDAIHDWPLAQGGDQNHISEEQMEAGTPVLIVLDR
ncbi:MAG: C39 family peptidase, partial [Patescibacteria group bacterium]|nr:C39 family peptidase [Patescibacteria group bacterium]